MEAPLAGTSHALSAHVGYPTNILSMCVYASSPPHTDPSHPPNKPLLMCVIEEREKQVLHKYFKFRSFLVTLINDPICKSLNHLMPTNLVRTQVHR